MNEEIKKMIAVPLDSSAASLKSIDYLNLIFGSGHCLDVSLLHIMPSLPPFLVETCMSNPDSARELRSIKEENQRIAQEILKTGKDQLIKKGCHEDNIQTSTNKEELGVPHDISRWAEDSKVDAILINSRGLTRIEAFFMGEVTMKLLECCRICPIWVMKGNVEAENVLLPVDASEKALKAVDHAGFMLSGTERKIILFHSKEELSSFVPKAMLGSIPQIKALWSDKSGKEIEPYLEKAKKILLDSGIKEENISIKVVEGTDKPHKDILKEAEISRCGTIVFGRQGISSGRDFTMGGVARKILEKASGMAVWIV